MADSCSKILSGSYTTKTRPRAFVALLHGSFLQAVRFLILKFATADSRYGEVLRAGVLAVDGARFHVFCRSCEGGRRLYSDLRFLLFRVLDFVSACFNLSLSQLHCG
jgi:hypothetical protein